MQPDSFLTVLAHAAAADGGLHPAPVVVGAAMAKGQCPAEALATAHKVEDALKDAHRALSAAWWAAFDAAYEAAYTDISDTAKSPDEDAWHAEGVRAGDAAAARIHGGIYNIVAAAVDAGASPDDIVGDGVGAMVARAVASAAAYGVVIDWWQRPPQELWGWTHIHATPAGWAWGDYCVET